MYEVHTSGTVLDHVNRVVSQEIGGYFEGVWLLLVYWDGVRGVGTIKVRIFSFAKISFQEFEVSLGFYCFEYISVKGDSYTVYT